MITVNKQRCTACKVQRDFDHFVNTKGRNLSRCEGCRSTKRKYRARHIEKVRAYQKAYSEKNFQKKRYIAARAHDKKMNQESCTENEYLAVAKINICVYCGLQDGIGIDRLDNTIGHVLNNIVPCCEQCNYTRGDIWTVGQMVQIGDLIRQFRIERGENVVEIETLRDLRSKILWK